MEDRVLHFKRQISGGPNYVCQSCDRRRFPTQVRVLNKKGKFTSKKLIQLCTVEFLSTVIKDVTDWQKDDLVIVLCHDCLKKVL